MKNKEVIIKLEQIYQSTVNNFRRVNDVTIDVPDTPEDDEYKTNIPVGEDIEEPVIKTKKGKTVLREPPDEDPEENEIKDVEFLDDEGDEIKSLDRSEPEETVTDLDDNIDPSEIKNITVIGKDGKPLKHHSKDNKIVSEQKEDKPKKKNIKKEKTIKEPKTEDDPNDMGSLAQDNMGEQNPATGTDPNTQQGMENPDPTQQIAGNQDPSTGTGADQTLSGFGSDPTVDPMTGEKKKTAHDVGRIYELKKIYGRLLAIESQLSFSADIELLRLRKFVSDSIELFETLISNVDAYLEEIDDIIVMYYNFLETIYEILKKYYKGKQSEEKKEQNKKK